MENFFREAAITAAQFEELQKTMVWEYSEEQGWFHHESLLKHFEVNIEKPENQYFIIDFRNIPSWVYENGVLMHNLRAKSWALTDFSGARTSTIPQELEFMKHF